MNNALIGMATMVRSKKQTISSFRDTGIFVDIMTTMVSEKKIICTMDTVTTMYLAPTAGADLIGNHQHG